MELDDLKQAWEASSEHATPLNNNIMQMIQNKSYGPVAYLKKRFKRQLVILPLAVLFLINTLSRHHDIFSDALFWFYIGICIATCGYFLYSYRLLSRLQSMDNMVKPNMERQIQILEKGFKVRLLAVRILLAVFLTLLEVLMHYQQEPSLAKWAAQPISLRLGIYALGLMFFYFFSKLVFNHKYGKHIVYLKNLVQQMQ